MTEMGYIAASQTFYRKFVNNVTMTNRNLNKSQTLSTDFFNGIFMAFIISQIFALFVLAIEILYFKYNCKLKSKSHTTLIIVYTS